MLTSLELQNFRAWADAEVELGKINLFFGPNNSGKSSILSSLLILAQTLESPDSQVRLLLNGTRAEFGTYKDVVHDNDVRKRLGIGLTYSSAKKHEEWAPQPAGRVFFEYAYRRYRKEIVVSRIEAKPEDGQSFIAEGDGTGAVYAHMNPKRHGKRTRIDLWKFIPRPHLYLERDDESMEFLESMERVTFGLFRYLRHMEYLGPFRQGPSRTYLYSGENPSSVGIHGERAIDLLVMDRLRRGEAGKHILTRVNKWLSSAELAKRLSVQRLTERHFEIRISQYLSGESENLADVGYGCSQVIPLLVAGYNLPRGGLLAVEQPELHLHPRAQAALGDFFYELSQNSVQTFIETHSEHLLLRLQAYVATGKLSPEDVSVYYVDARQSGKRLTRIKLNEDGFFINEWPSGFFPERLHEARKIAKKSL